MRAGRLRDTGRSFCCTRKYRKGRKRKKSERKSGNLLNTDLQGVCIKTVSGSTGPDGAGSIGYPEGFTISNTHIISAKIRFTDNEYYVFPYINSDIINEKAYIYFQYKKDSVSFNFGNNLANNTLEVIFARFGS